jgi:MscS family membrane protein
MKRNILLVITLLAGWTFYAQHTDLSTPRNTVYTHLENLKPGSYYPEISAKTFYGINKEKAVDKAVKLKYIYEGKGLKIDYSAIPNDPNYTDSINFPFPKNAYVLFPIRLPDIYLEKYDGKWYYSKYTAGKIDLIFSELYPYGIEYVQKIPDGLKVEFLGLQIWQWLGFILILITAFLLHLIVRKLFYWFLVFIKNRLAPIGFDVERINERLKQFADPLSYIISIYFILRFLPSLLFPVRVGSFVISGLHIAEVVFWIFVFLRLVDVIMSFYLTRAEQTSSKLDNQLVPILRNTLKAIVIIGGIFKLLITFGADPQAVIAGASIGGLAVGLASQDTIKNMIGTFMIFIDKPFRIGDWIAFNNVEGSVEEVGFRSTIIRAPDTTLIKVPNSQLSEMAINNKGQRVYRRYQTRLGIRYDTPPHLIEAFVEGIKQIIEMHPLTRNSADYTPYNIRPYNVEFVDYGDFSLQILVNVYFKTNDWGEEMHGRHVLHLGILKLAEKLGVGFAFPTQTLQMELFPGHQPVTPDYPKSKEEIHQRMKEAFEEFKRKISKY